ncbi:MAG TPA: zf-HC2 domain-containing protein [Acidimicrobiia bacterium]|jgi:anti-sigma factor RsiW
MTLEQRPFEEDALSAYLDGELDAETRRALEHRLAESAEWRAILDELRETRSAVRALPQVSGTPEFWSRLLAGDDTVVDFTVERARRHRGWRVALAAAAAALVLVVAGAALVPKRDRVRPAVATFADQHAARASLGDDTLSQLASVGVQGLRR